MSQGDTVLPGIKASGDELCVVSLLQDLHVEPFDMKNSPHWSVDFAVCVFRDPSLHHPGALLVFSHQASFTMS
tara:strand:+ start:249 stop:467 length:219 start_codon:yes stop_codon:yes gene_type:complete